jgi:hypothetical protein
MSKLRSLLLGVLALSALAAEGWLATIPWPGLR